MPVKITENRRELAKKSLITGAIVLGVPLIPILIVMMVGAPGRLFLTEYLFVALFAEGFNALLAFLYGFVLRKNKIAYTIAPIALFVIGIVLGIVGGVISETDTGTMLQFAWVYAAIASIFILSESFQNIMISARSYIPCIIVAAIPALQYWWLYEMDSDYGYVVPSAVYGRKTAGIVALALCGLIAIVGFIAFWVKYSDLVAGLGKATLTYDVDTKDEREYHNRETEDDAYDKIPRLYEGDVWVWSKGSIDSIGNAIIAYLNECSEAIDDLLNAVKGTSKTVDEWNSFVNDYNRWVDNLKKDQKEMIEFLGKIAGHMWLELDYGKTIEYDFTNFKITHKMKSDSPNTFHIVICGFSRTYSTQWSHIGKKKMTFHAPDFDIAKAGHHSAEVDSEADRPGYHPMGTPMPEDDE